MFDDLFLPKRVAIPERYTGNGEEAVGRLEGANDPAFEHSHKVVV
jgi:hypothetical protein